MPGPVVGRNPLWWARLRRGSPRYAIWRQILGTDDVPLKAPWSFTALLGEPVNETAECYELDVAMLDAQQKFRLAEWIVQAFGADINDALYELDNRGFPIREADVFVSFSLRAFI